MDTPLKSLFALTAALDSGRRTAWTEWLRDLLFSHRFTLEGRDHARAQTIHRVTVRAGPRDAPVLVEDRGANASAGRHIATGWPVECIRTVLHCDGAATTLDTHWYPAGPRNGVTLDSPRATAPRILMTREGALDPELPGRIARLLTEPMPEGGVPHSAERLLVLARQFASILPRAGADEETRAARGAALQVYIEGRLRALDAPTRESLRTLLGEDTARFVAVRKGGKAVGLRPPPSVCAPVQRHGTVDAATPPD